MEKIGMTHDPSRRLRPSHGARTGRAPATCCTASTGRGWKNCPRVVARAGLTRWGRGAHLAAARPEPEPARPARAGDLRHVDARRLREGRPSGRRSSTDTRSRRSRATTRASWSTPSTPRAAGARRSSSTPARSRTTRGASTTHSPRSRVRSSSCTSPTRTPASRGGTRASCRRWPPGTIVGLGMHGYELAGRGGGRRSWRHDRPAPDRGRAPRRQRCAHRFVEHRRAPRQRPDQPALADRVHRFERRRCGARRSSSSSSPTAATASRPSARWLLPACDRRGASSAVPRPSIARPGRAGRRVPRRTSAFESDTPQHQQFVQFGSADGRRRSCRPWA